MLDDLSDRERYGVAGVFAVSIIASFGIGLAVSGGAEPADSQDVPKSQIQQQVSTLMDQQVQSQRQQLRTAVNQSENLTMEDVSIDAEVQEITESEIDSLYKVNVSTTGQVPNQLGGGTQSMDQNQVLYISSDGRYLFPEPTDLQEGQTQQPQQPTGPQ